MQTTFSYNYKGALEMNPSFFCLGMEKKGTALKKSVDYFPFGMMLPGRNGGASDYKFGYMGYEGDPEIKGEGNSYTTEFRQYDSRVGRWLSIDPIVKTHESPYAAYSNNPIWFSDPNGADSTLAAGGTTWNWTVEKGDTYSSISKRTGVSIDNLQAWNDYEDTKIPVGATLYLSDPTAPPASTIPSVSTEVGDININVFATNYNENTPRRLTLSMDVDGAEGVEDSEFIWFQTYENNDPTSTQRGGTSMGPDRTLMSEPFYGVDGTSGMRNATLSGNATNYNVPLFQPGEGAFLDSPGRGMCNNGVSYWNSTITLLQKTDAGYVVVTTVYFSFEVHPDGSTVMTTGQEIDGTFIPGNLRIGTNFDTNNGAYKHHQEQLQIWIDAHP